MNNEMYLILIVAVLALIAFMLYARFASRSREKSLHHTLQDQAAPVTPSIREVDAESEMSSAGAGTSPAMDLKPLFSDREAKENEELEESDEKYLDELQEAAAGLAMLMRSSPGSKRAEPVVFAPEEEVEADAEAIVEGEPSESNESLSEFETTKAMDDAVDQIESLLVEPPAMGAIPEALPQDEFSGFGREALTAVLGEEVAGRFTHLDTALDSLESLVSEMEGELLSFDEFLSAPDPEGVVEAA